MGKWVMKAAPKWIPVPIDPKLYEQNIAEIAELLLQWFCQLDPKPVVAKAIRPEPLPTWERKDRQ